MTNPVWASRALPAHRDRPGAVEAQVGAPVVAELCVPQGEAAVPGSGALWGSVGPPLPGADLGSGHRERD